MSLRKLAGETAVYGLSSILGRVLAFLLVPLYTDAFSTVAFGIQTDVYAVVSFLLVFATLRLDVAYFRFAPTESRDALLSTTVLAVLGLSGVLGLLLLMGSPLLAQCFGYPAYRWLFAVAGGILIFDAIIEVPLAKLRMDGRPWRFAAVRLTGIAVMLSLNLLFFYVLPRVDAPPRWLYRPEVGIGYIFFANIVASGVVVAMLLPELRGLTWRIDRALLRRLLAFSLPLVVVGGSYIVNEMLDRKLLPLVWPGGQEEGLALLGVYGANYKLAILLALFTQAFRYGAEPFFFRESANANARANYARLARYFLIAALIGLLVVALFLPVFSQLFLRKEAFREGTGVVPILLFANLCLGMYYNFSVWYKVTDRTRTGAYIGLFGAAITIVLNLLLIPRFGYWGCAWTTLLCYATMMALTYVLGQRHYPVRYPLRAMLTYVALALVLLAVSAWLSPKLTVRGGSWGEWAELVGINAVLLAVFLAVAAWVELPRLRRLGPGGASAG